MLLKKPIYSCNPSDPCSPKWTGIGAFGTIEDLLRVVEAALEGSVARNCPGSVQGSIMKRGWLIQYKFSEFLNLRILVLLVENRHSLGLHTITDFKKIKTKKAPR